MAQTIKTRILLKTATCKEWENNSEFVPLRGEVCIYIDWSPVYAANGDVNYYIPGLKIGDGRSSIEELPFVNDKYITDLEIDDLFSEKS